MNVAPNQLVPDEAFELIDTYLLVRDERRTQRWADGEQDLGDNRYPKLVIILRGLPGAGKTFFAMAVALYAHARHLRTVTCSADDWFETPQGYQWNVGGLRSAHDDCFQRFSSALASRACEVVIVDNTNVRHTEFQRYQLAAEAADICQFVSFACDSLIEARWQAARSFHNVPDDVIVARFGEYHRANTQMRGIWVEPAILEPDEDQEQRAQLRRDAEARAIEEARLLAQAQVELQRQRRREEAAEHNRRWLARQI